MRKLVVHMQSTLDNRIANAQGAFWEPFPWGEPEVAYINQFFRTADTWALSRVMYDAIVPWWDGVATGHLPADAPEITPAFAEFAQLQHRMTKVVLSKSLQSGDGRIVLRGDLAGQLAKLKQQDGVDIILSCGPATLGPIASTSRLVDEYLIAVPAVITEPPGGPRLLPAPAAPAARGDHDRGSAEAPPGHRAAVRPGLPPLPGDAGTGRASPGRGRQRTRRRVCRWLSPLPARAPLRRPARGALGPRGAAAGGQVRLSGHQPCCEPRQEVGSVLKPGTSCMVVAGMAWVVEAGGQRNRAAALAASWSLSPITVAPELTGRGGVGPQVALRSNSRKKS
jgi:hypothetical protein